MPKSPFSRPQKNSSESNIFWTNPRAYRGVARTKELPVFLAHCSHDLSKSPLPPFAAERRHPCCGLPTWLWALKRSHQVANLRRVPESHGHLWPWESSSLSHLEQIEREFSMRCSRRSNRQGNCTSRARYQTRIRYTVGIQNQAHIPTTQKVRESQSEKSPLPLLSAVAVLYVAPTESRNIPPSEQHHEGLHRRNGSLLPRDLVHQRPLKHCLGVPPDRRRPPAHHPDLTSQHPERLSELHRHRYLPKSKKIPFCRGAAPPAAWPAHLACGHEK